jgi:2-aminoadipate transaminase
MMDSLELEIDRSSSRALYLQIADAVRERISRGQLHPGVKLPSTRAVARQLGVHRRTVIQAFNVLELDGWVTSGVGQGTFVHDRAGIEGAGPAGAATSGQPVPDDPSAHTGGFDWEPRLAHGPDRSSDFWRFWLRNRPPEDCIRLTGATADPELFPAGELREVMGEVLRTQGASALDYGPPEGYPPLREWLAGRLEDRGVRVDPAQVLIVNGSQQGMDLLARLLLEPGDDVLVEEPGYTNGFRLFQAHGAQVTGIPMDAGGLQLDRLDAACRQHSPKLLYTMPIFQNPTGLVLAEDRAGPLLEICARHQVPVLEDHFDADLAYGCEPPRPLRARDDAGRVILLGTFSKILFPGLRLGWLVLPRALVGPMSEIKQMTDLSSSLLAQHAMDLFCRRGLLDRHLERIRQVNRTRLQVLLEALEEALPPGAFWTRPQGGMTLWVRLPEGLDSLELLHQSRRRGLDFSPGPLFFPNGGGSEFLRLTYVRETEERIRQGVKILGSVIEENADRVSAEPAARPFL